MTERYPEITENPQRWILDNCCRIDILFSADVPASDHLLSFIEAALHFKYEPVYEGKHHKSIAELPERQSA